MLVVAENVLYIILLYVVFHKVYSSSSSSGPMDRRG